MLYSLRYRGVRVFLMQAWNYLKSRLGGLWAKVSEGEEPAEMRHVHRPAKVIALIYAYPLHIGGVETHLLTLLHHADRSRYRWLVVAAASPEFTSRARAQGAQVIPWRPASALDVVALMRLVRLLRAQGVDLLHLHGPRTIPFGRIAASLLQVPVVVTVHLPSYVFAYGDRMRARFKRWCYRRVERVWNYRFIGRLIYVSSSICQDALASGVASRGQVTVIENGVDPRLSAEDDHRGRVREALAVPPEAKVICCVARLDEQKGIDILLEAMLLLQPDRLELRLWLLGDGPRRAELQAQARRLGASVQFLGFRHDVPDLLKASDIFVLPSRYEAMSLAVLEAMAVGLPSVVSDVGENARLIEDGMSGRVVPPTDPVALAAALRQLLDDPALCRRMGQMARRQVASYSDLRMAQRTQEVYEALGQPWANRRAKKVVPAPAAMANKTSQL